MLNNSQARIRAHLFSVAARTVCNIMTELSSFGNVLLFEFNDLPINGAPMPISIFVISILSLTQVTGNVISNEKLKQQQHQHGKFI